MPANVIFYLVPMKKVLPYLCILVLAACSTPRHEEPEKAPMPPASVKTGVETTGEVRHTDAIVQEDERQGYTTDDIVKMVKKPATREDILRNIKFIFEHDLLIKPGFYSDEALMRLFGGGFVRWRDNSAKEKHGTVEKFGVLLENHAKYTGEGLDFDLRYLDPKERTDKQFGIRAYCTFPPSDHQVHADLIEAIFGQPTEVLDPKALGMHLGRALRQPTHPLGNRILVYRYVSANAHGEIRVFTFQDGMVQSINLNEEGKE